MYPVFIAALFMIARHGNNLDVHQQMNDKEVVVYIHSGILLSYKNECIWVSSSEVDEPGAYYTEWSKLERERKILLSMHIYGIYFFNFILFLNFT